VRGDWTPYWEDGAGSSALETALNRASSDRVAQAESLWAMLEPASYPAGPFEEAWRSVCSTPSIPGAPGAAVGEPMRAETLDQWTSRRATPARPISNRANSSATPAALRRGAEHADALTSEHHLLAALGTRGHPATSAKAATA